MFFRTKLYKPKASQFFACTRQSLVSNVDTDFLHLHNLQCNSRSLETVHITGMVELVNYLG